MGSRPCTLDSPAKPRFAGEFGLATPDPMSRLINMTSDRGYGGGLAAIPVRSRDGRARDRRGFRTGPRGAPGRYRGPARHRRHPRRPLSRLDRRLHGRLRRGGCLLRHLGLPDHRAAAARADWPAGRSPCPRSTRAARAACSRRRCSSSWSPWLPRSSCCRPSSCPAWRRIRRRPPSTSRTCASRSRLRTTSPPARRRRRSSTSGRSAWRSSSTSSGRSSSCSWLEVRPGPCAASGSSWRPSPGPCSCSRSG